MQIMKWEMIDNIHEKSNQELLQEGWEPFASDSYGRPLFRRPVGYIEVEEKVVKEKEKIKPEQVITKEVSYNLDEVKKVEPEKPSQEIQRRIDNREFDIEM